MAKPSGHAIDLSTKRWAYFIPRDAFVQGKGFRVSVVIAGERGHIPTGTASEPPWFWGMTYLEAEERAAQTNAADLNLSTTDVVEIYKSAGVL